MERVVLAFRVVQNWYRKHSFLRLEGCNPDGEGQLVHTSGMQNSPIHIHEKFKTYKGSAVL